MSRYTWWKVKEPICLQNFCQYQYCKFEIWCQDAFLRRLNVTIDRKFAFSHRSVVLHLVRMWHIHTRNSNSSPKMFIFGSANEIIAKSYTNFPICYGSFAQTIHCYIMWQTDDYIITYWWLIIPCFMNPFNALNIQ